MNEPDWISVGRYLPTVTDEILCRSDKKLIRVQYDHSVGVHFGYLYQYNEEDPTWVMEGPDGYLITNVTHWAEAPKGEVND